ncbi:hypothetical protein JCM18899A_54000 [Nocardioides sp. AN3]
MSTATNGGSRPLAVQLRLALLELARREDECAAEEAATQPYWAPCPPTVQGHRAAAAALRDRADELLVAARPTLTPLTGDAA